jgi:exoribonuclease R
MISYELHVNDRNYTSWEIIDTSSLNKVSLDIIPNESKLFSNDIFTVDKCKKVEILESPIRYGKSLPCVLILAGNKTYGKQFKETKHKGKQFKETTKFSNSITDKNYYKCIPNNILLPPFLVPYQIKNLGFSKVLKNIFVTITFYEWIDKHPIGKLDTIIGPVDILNNYYEYQLYCKNLNTSIHQFQKNTSKFFEKNTSDSIIQTIHLKYPSIQNRTDPTIWNIITIDSPNTLDFDDAFSIIYLDNDIQQLSIYISNVSIWMDTINLWDSFSQRISTIYLPDKKRPMLPSILTNGLCSLQQNLTRIAFVMDIFIQNNQIINIDFQNCSIKVSHNFFYEETSLLTNQTYNNIFNITSKLNIPNISNQPIHNIQNSSEMVSYLMILMNYYSAQKLLTHKIGIFRTTLFKQPPIIPESTPHFVSKFIQQWNTSSAHYINAALIHTNIQHHNLGIDAYIHITSPIRRIVDLLNMLKIQQITGIIQFSHNADSFYNKWILQLEYINTTMKTIRKLQCESNLLQLCYNDTNLFNIEYEGYLFNKKIINDSLFQFIVFLPKLKLTSRIITTSNLDNFNCKKFKLFLFNDEETFKKKIRLHLIN